jgi:hypothetical protein
MVCKFGREHRRLAFRTDVFDFIFSIIPTVFRCRPSLDAPCLAMPPVSRCCPSPDTSACPIRPSSDAAAGMWMDGWMERAACAFLTSPHIASRRIGARDGEADAGAPDSFRGWRPPIRDRVDFGQFRRRTGRGLRFRSSAIIVAFHSLCGLLRDPPNFTGKKTSENSFFQ